MKIGITCYPTYGGSGVVATELGLELAHRGHEIHFISYAQPIRLRGDEANIHYHEVEVSRYPLFDYPPYDLALATRMAEVSQLYDLDLLHVHYASGCTLAEAYYQSVFGPYQLLVVGDPLCRPWARIPVVSIEGIEPKATINAAVYAPPTAHFGTGINRGTVLSVAIRARGMEPSVSLLKQLRDSSLSRREARSAQWVA